MAALGPIKAHFASDRALIARRWRDYSQLTRLCNGRDMNFQEPLSGLFERIARAIERLGPQEAEASDFAPSDAFVWHPETGGFIPVADVNSVPLSLLKD
jgi:hypothetical protein